MRRTWPLALGVVAAAVVASRYREAMRSALANVRTFSAPTAAIYDAVASPVLDGFFTNVALDLVASRAAPRVLEIGCGPGRLAARIAEVSRDARVVGVDVAPPMLVRANAWAARSGVGSRVSFVLADAGSLPFRRASFDAVVTTLSLHHWPDPAAGLREIRRVLQPEGVARIYDIADWIGKIEPGGTREASDELFSEAGWTRVTAARVGPVPLLYRAEIEL